jgi:hypothetical protein
MDYARRIKAQPPDTIVHPPLIDHKQATLNVIFFRIPEISTFVQLGELIGHSHESLRQRPIKALPAASSGCLGEDPNCSRSKIRFLVLPGNK